jgi:hypothetical protein
MRFLAAITLAAVAGGLLLDKATAQDPLPGVPGPKSGRYPIAMS